MIEIKFIRVMDAEDQILEQGQAKIIKQDDEDLEEYKNNLIIDKKKQYKKRVIIDFILKRDGAIKRGKN